MRYLFFLLLIHDVASAQSELGYQYVVGGPIIHRSLLFHVTDDTLRFKFPTDMVNEIGAENKIKIHLASGEVLHFTNQGRDSTAVTYSYLTGAVLLAPRDRERILNSWISKVSFETLYNDFEVVIPKSKSRLINQALK